MLTSNVRKFGKFGAPMFICKVEWFYFWLLTPKHKSEVRTSYNQPYNNPSYTTTPSSTLAHPKFP